MAYDMQNIMKTALDYQSMGDVLCEIEYFNDDDNLRSYEWFSYYEELFIDLARAASELNERAYHHYSYYIRKYLVIVVKYVDTHSFMCYNVKYKHEIRRR